jgi:hypothetical protein
VLARRWARVKLDELVTAGNPTAITAHALRYGLVSPTTSMVAIGDEVVIQGGVKHSVPVPVSVPAGMHWQAVEQQTSVDTTRAEEEPRNANHKSVDKTPDVDTRRLAAPKAPNRKVHDKKAHDDDRDRAGGDADADDDSRSRAGAGAAREDESTAEKRELSPAPVAMNTPQDYDEVTIAGEASGYASNRQTRRLALALGGGVALEHGHADPMTALTGRFDFGARTRFGIEGSLWLVGGLHLQGDTLASVARRGIARFFELRAGFGVHFGGGVGPALELTLRTRLPIDHIGGYLRYDAALLFHDQTRDGQNAASVGIEASF